MLKKIIDKTAFDAAGEEIQKLYKVGEDNKYHLELEDDDAAELHRAKDHEVGLRQIAERDLATAKTELATAQARITELEKSQSSTTAELRADHERAMLAATEKHAKDKAALEATIKKIFVRDVALSIAKEIAIDEGAAELLAESIEKRLVVEMVGGDPKTRVLNADLTASNSSPDDLKKEYLQLKKFAGILRASEASGGGASGSGGGGGAASKKLDDLTEAERNQMVKDNPVEWNRLVKEKQDSLQYR